MPEPLVLSLPMRFTGSGPYPSAGLNIWINEPFNLLGEPVLTDKTGDMFLLPPLIGKIGGQAAIASSDDPDSELIRESEKTKISRERGVRYYTGTTPTATV